MKKDIYEVVRQDNGQRLWYIWNTVTGQAESDGIGETIYYDTYEEAQDECDDLNAREV